MTILISSGLIPRGLIRLFVAMFKHEPASRQAGFTNGHDFFAKIGLYCSIWNLTPRGYVI